MIIYYWKIIVDGTKKCPQKLLLLITEWGI